MSGIRVRITVVVTLVFALVATLTAVGTLWLVDRSLSEQVDDRSDELAADTQAALLNAALAGEAVGDELFEHVDLYIADAAGDLVSVETGLPAEPSGDFVVVSGAGSELLVGSRASGTEVIDAGELREELDAADAEWEECLAVQGVELPDEDGSLSFDEIDAAWAEFDEDLEQTGGACDRFLPDEELIALDELAYLTEEFVTTGEEILTPAGAVQVLAASSLAEATASLDSVRDVLLVVVPLLVIAVGALVWFATGRALHPVVAITDQANEISAMTLHERVPVPGSDDEIAELATTMNAMLDRLESAAERQQRFVSDSSHELRTPVAAIRSEMEVALAGDGTDWPAVAERVLDEDARLERMVADLLVLARHDEGRSGPSAEIDLDDVVYEQARRARRLPVDVSGVSAVKVRGSRTDLDRAIGHLLDNATRHGATAVWVTLSQDGEVARLDVSDDGPGVPPGERQRIFERFSRLEEARTRDAGGAGLGLAVVAAIADSHGGSVNVEDRPGGGATFSFTVPTV